MRPSSVWTIFLALLVSTASITLGSQERQIGGVGLTVYSDTNFRGRNATFRQDTPDLQPFGLNDRILYEDRGFGGRSYTATQSVPLLSSFNDRASSARVEGGVWEICDDRDYGGRCVSISSDVSDLASVGLRNRVSSVRLRGSPR